MKILQINTTVNSGSTGRIAEDIGQVLLANGHQSYIAYGRGDRPSQSKLIKIGTKFDFYIHGLKTAIFDRHGFGSKNATKQFIKRIDEIKPDLIALHNLHGYYINIEILFNYLSKKQVPVVWTLFDCWGFTGHCSYFDDISCEKWKKQCFECPKTKKYPSSYVIDNSKLNFNQKNKLFNSPVNLELIVHSKWLQVLVKKSFLKKYNTNHIFSGIDLEIFDIKKNDAFIKEKYKIVGSKIVLGVASIWDKRKGLDDFTLIQNENNGDFQIVLVGLSDQQLQDLPNGIIGIKRTENTEELAAIYSMANVFVNPTYQDNFPTTNLEALACGTPVITYNTGGSPEAIDEKTGIVVTKGNKQELTDAIKLILKNPKSFYQSNCRSRAVENFNKFDRYNDYLLIFEDAIKKQKNITDVNL